MHVINSLFFYLFIFYHEVKSLVAQTLLELSMQPKLASSFKFSFLMLLKGQEYRQAPPSPASCCLAVSACLFSSPTPSLGDRTQCLTHA